MVSKGHIFIASLRNIELEAKVQSTNIHFSFSTSYCIYGEGKKKKVGKSDSFYKSWNSQNIGILHNF
jgi:hypothetical protein